MSFNWSETWMTIHHLDIQNKVTHPLPHTTLPWLIYSIPAGTSTPFVPTHGCLQACTYTQIFWAHNWAGLPSIQDSEHILLVLVFLWPETFFFFLVTYWWPTYLQKSTLNLTVPKDISPIASNGIISLLTWNLRASHGDNYDPVIPMNSGVGDRAFVLLISVYLL